MKINDCLLRYPTKIRNDGICRVRLFVNERQALYALITDMEQGNCSRSAELSMDTVIPQLMKQLGITAVPVFILHIEERYAAHTFHLMTMAQVYDHRQWRPIKQEAVCAMLQCDMDEFSTLTHELPHFSFEIERLRHQIDPYMDFPKLPANAITQRRIEIMEQAVSKKELSALINTGASENALQKLLKRDLSMIADVYANPKEEYIVFPEFPIGNGGRVDFAIFTDRSRMAVTLIEVKGAGFNLMTQSGTKKLSSKASDAYHQLKERESYIYKNYESFRTYVHELRKKTEAGETKYHPFLGPDLPLRVDPNKHIKLQFALICGRTVDHVLESEIRHNYEKGELPPLRVDSWDTFAYKLTRH